ncbi:class I SAM-dependent methyltransferase [Lichenicoccus roseus]|uniref:Class I SAM-dependent methyltransferase n=1 Tax=Lichenicoccus roseus TaxID=2683649 RepID=A0A5R9J5R3_9PROT|nr:class I SAM-dependent methyltransferase [Lichenicoccus roseus]TLU70951.1 class I SAM-dependent methyltransferase [Lichenicoccus roseus]
MTKRVLHVGCGAQTPGKLHPVFEDQDWNEVRLDIDASVSPDIVASMTDMSPVADGTVDAVFSSHNLEHLYPHEVPVALAEFRRVLRSDGFALITLPDLQEVARLVASEGLSATAYMSALGPIEPLDILFGYRGALAGGNLFMAHHTGFTSASLMGALGSAGFAAVTVQRVPSSFSLWAIGFCTRPGEQELQEAQDRMLPLHAAVLAARSEPGLAAT